jgi:glucan phosphoethanolaminetransferase (alkaline phosphatase superfamily)
MPGDIIPYKLLSLFVVIFILVLFHIRKTPALSVASQWGFSFQFVYSCLHAFALFKNNIHQYFMEISLGSAPLAPEPAKVLALIRKPYTDFQRNYLQLNRRPCFMRKFINKTNAPPIGIFAPAGAAT